MNRLIIDGTKGISGNSLLGAALSLGLPLTLLKESCECLLGANKVNFRVEKYKEIVYFNTITLEAGKQVDVLKATDVLRMLEASSLEEGLKKKTEMILRALFDSKARAHGEPLAEVQFRYEGMLDTIVDALGAALTLTYFKAQKFLVSGPVETGSGSIRLPHRELPIPVPMVTLLLEGFHWEKGYYNGEKITPTGAAILKVFAKEIIPAEYSAGKKGYSFPTIPYEEKDCFSLTLQED